MFSEIFSGLNVQQLTGLGALAFLAIREKTTLYHQWKEWGFTDIPPQVIVDCELGDAHLMEFVKELAAYIQENLPNEPKQKAIAD